MACKKIGYEFYCKELFVVKHRSKYNCENVIYFKFRLRYYKGKLQICLLLKTDITPTVLDRGNEIILANWPDDKLIICNANNDILVEIPSHPYVLVSRSVFCNCGIEAENNFLLESHAACHDVESKLVMYFMVNTVFVNYLDN